MHKMQAIVKQILHCTCVVLYTSTKVHIKSCGGKKKSLNVLTMYCTIIKSLYCILRRICYNIVVIDTIIVQQ